MGRGVKKILVVLPNRNIVNKGINKNGKPWAIMKVEKYDAYGCLVLISQRATRHGLPCTRHIFSLSEQSCPFENYQYYIDIVSIKWGPACNNK